MHPTHIRPVDARDHEPIVELSLKAWSPIFGSFRTVWGPSLYERFFPDWKKSQAADVTNALHQNPTWVAVTGNTVTGFINVRCDDETLVGEIYMIAVDPDHQRQGLGTLLTQRALTEMRAHGMTVATVSTGGDPGHAPARTTYERNGFVAFPQVLYSMLLSPEPTAEPDVTTDPATTSAGLEPPSGIGDFGTTLLVERADYASIDRATYASIRRVLTAAFQESDDEGSLQDFSDFDHWFFAVERSEVVAVTGLLFREILVGGNPVTVAGIGGVATDSRHRNRGYARHLVDTALRFANDQRGAPFGLLQCTPDLVPFYATRGWRQVPDSLVCRQSDGELHRSPELPMVTELNTERWPAGLIDMNGLPW